MTVGGVTVPRPPRIVYVLLLVLWAAGVFYLSDRSHPEDTVGWLVELPDWLLHGAEYAVGGFLACGALRTDPVRGAGGALALLVVWGLLDEWHQSFVPGRDASVGDLVADTAGALLGILVHVALDRRRAS